MKAFIIKSPTGALLPATSVDAEQIAKLKNGEIYEIYLKKKRSNPYLRRWMKLLHYAYDIWCETREPVIHKGEVVQPNFDRFREDIIITAGFYECTFNINGELRLIAKSISFDKMEQDEFEKLYDASISVILSKVMNNTKMSPVDLKIAIDNILSYEP